MTTEEAERELKLIWDHSPNLTIAEIIAMRHNAYEAKLEALKNWHPRQDASAAMEYLNEGHSDGPWKESDEANLP